jgi:hypothetical protein
VLPRSATDTKSLQGFTEAEEVETLGSYDSILVYKITLNVGLVRYSGRRTAILNLVRYSSVHVG